MKIVIKQKLKKIKNFLSSSLNTTTRTEPFFSIGPIVFNCPIVRPLNALTRGGALSLFCANIISSFPFALISFVTVKQKKRKTQKRKFDQKWITGGDQIKKKKKKK